MKGFWRTGKGLVAANDLACHQSQPDLIIFGVLELLLLSNQQLWRHPVRWVRRGIQNNSTPCSRLPWCRSRGRSIRP